MRMDPIKYAVALKERLRQHYKECGFEDEDAEAAIMFFSLTYLLLEGSILPTHDRRFPEVLRAVANELELMSSQKEKK